MGKYSKSYFDNQNFIQILRVFAAAYRTTMNQTNKHKKSHHKIILQDGKGDSSDK